MTARNVMRGRKLSSLARLLACCPSAMEMTEAGLASLGDGVSDHVA